MAEWQTSHLSPWDAGCLWSQLVQTFIFTGLIFFLATGASVRAGQLWASGDGDWPAPSDPIITLVLG
jgi:hypothetical protein